MSLESNLYTDPKLVNPDYIEVKESPIHGKGIFSLRTFNTGEMVMIISGEMINADECMRRENEEDNVYIFYNGDDCFIDTANSGKIRFINHSCKPNCKVLDRSESTLILEAQREIAIGEEITINYDYEEIFESCRIHNPHCLNENCEAFLNHHKEK
ncbi:MAG: SET domain-containing protein-lysine N-methyltransferase [Chloroherpetonaceae bacterium]|nr:SET domain-containing protein-lysine N-methyltransferase [Chloroherpetonaceae bacterium]